MDWSTLEHAYGDASDIPALLADLSPSHTDAWYELGSRLCHQDSVYSASFAALPVLVDIAGRWQPKDRTHPITLAADILACYDGRAVSRDAFDRLVGSLVPRLQRLCRESLAETGLSQQDFVYLLQAARSLDGDPLWGRELDHLADGEFPGTCPHCGVDLYLVIGQYGFFTTAQEWVERPGKPGFVQELRRRLGMIGPRPDVQRRPIEPNRGVLPDDGQCLFEHARAAQQTEVGEWIRHLFGATECPSCGRRFDVQDAIAID